MARLNGLTTISGRGIYWQLIDHGGSDVLTIAVPGQTPGSFKEALQSATVPWIRPPKDAHESWTFDLDAMKEHAHTENTPGGFPNWVGGRVEVQPSSVGSAIFDITPDTLR